MGRWPVIAELKTLLEECGATGAAMSGSGGAVFGIFAAPATAALAADEVRRRYPAAQVFTTSTHWHGIWPVISRKIVSRANSCHKIPR